MRRTLRLPVAVAVSSLALVALVAPAAAALQPGPLPYPAVVQEGVTVITPFPDYSISYECDLLDTGDSTRYNRELFHVPGGSLTLTLDCLPSFEATDRWTGDSAPDGFDVQTVDGVTTVTVDPGIELEIYNIPGAGTFRSYINYVASEEIDDPSGTLLHDVTLNWASASGGVASFGNPIEGPLSSCNVDFGDRPYVTQSFTVTADGDYTFRMVGYTPTQGRDELQDDATPNPWGPMNPFSDAALVLYSVFDSEATEQNVESCYDINEAAYNLDDEGIGAYDSDGQHIGSTYPELVMTGLTAGTYTLVLIPNYPSEGLIPSSEGALQPAYTVDGLGALGTLAMQLEFWGPAGGIQLAGTGGNGNGNGGGLAATGADTESALLIGGTALLLLAAGITMVTLRHRRTARA